MRRFTQFLYSPDEGGSAPAPADTASAPDAPAPADTAPEEPSVNWQDRYESLRPEYTRTTQRLSELETQFNAIRNDPEAQAQFLRELGYDLPDQDEDLTGLDPAAQQQHELERRLAAIEQQHQQTQAQAEQAQQLAAAEAHFNQSFTELATENGGQPLDPETQDLVVAKALTMPPDENGMPPVKEAYKVIEGFITGRQQKYAATKRTPHPFTPNGAEGTQQPDLDDPQQRQAWMAQRYADLSAD